MSDGITLRGFLAAYPEIYALIVILAGFIGAWVARWAVGMVTRLVNGATGGVVAADAELVSPAVERGLRALVFWGVVLISVFMALQQLQVDSVSIGISAVLQTIPQLLVGALIVAAGHIVGLLALQLVQRLEGGPAEHTLSARLAYAVVLTMAVLTALGHVGINVSFLTELLLLIIAITLGGLSLAFALGARQLVANLVAQSDLRRYHVGERIRIGETEGEIIEIHRTGVVLSSASGLVSVPAHLFAELPVLRVAPEEAE